MTLTEEQRAAINSGKAVSLLVDGTRCVLLREDLFAETQLAESSPRATYAVVLKALDQNDENVDQYLEYLNESR